MATVYFRGDRKDVTAVANRLAAIVAGNRADEAGIGEGFRTTLGYAALSEVKDAFIVKASGGTDEMGIRWPKLAPATIANRRIGNPRGTDAERIKERERIRKREYKIALKRYSVSLEPKEAQRRAAIVAGLKATYITGRTKVQTLGNRQVEILRDTSVLLNSLSPGEFNGSSYTPPNTEGGDEQIFRTDGGEVVVGTNVLYASTHQHGRGAVPRGHFFPTMITRFQRSGGTVCQH